MKVTEMNFRRQVIYRPGLLLCDRNEWRPLEMVAQKVCSMFDRLITLICSEASVHIHLI